MTTINFYQEGVYPYRLITEFIRSQRNIEKFAGLSREEVITEGGPFDLVYRFTDDEQQTLALAFRRDITRKSVEELYTLVYLDPSIHQLWKREMDKEVEIDEL